MSKKIYNVFLINFLFLITFSNLVFSKTLNKIEVNGNERIPRETILMFADVDKIKDVDTNVINSILKKLYKTNYFENVSIEYDEGILKINVLELPIVEKITYNGIKADKIKEEITKDLKLKSRSSFSKTILLEDNEMILNKLRDMGYYFATIESFTEDSDDNKVNIINEINLGEKAKISKISFIGDKIFKDRKLRNIIISEEYKFWKIVSGKKYLNENLILYDQRLLKNFYLNQGYYDVKINSSFAKSVDKDKFELIYNIDANKKIFFDNISIILPDDFVLKNYEKLNTLFVELKGEPYSINSVNEILNLIDEITLNEEFKSINATVDENIISDKINITFLINESEKYFVEKINIYGNNITRENVIRNQLEIDEGDPFNEILQKKSVNNIKSLNFFKNVNTEILDGKNENSKIININVEEKATGEISAGAGFGTSGSSFYFGIKENNYLGKGHTVDANATVSADSFKGTFGLSNPNYKNSDKAVFANIQAIEIDRTENFGYKTNKTGFEVGTKFEYLKQFNLGFSGRTFYENIETDSSASAAQKKQEGDYLDTFLNLSLDYDKRNQKFKTSKGFRSFYAIDLPVISDTSTLTNTYNYKIFSELYENNISTFSLFLKSANSINGEDIKLSERLSIPGSRLRGFEVGKIGPKDGIDYIGGNYLSAVNFTSTLPKILENAQNVDFLIFLDAANLWGVDYDSTIADGNKIRSSIGLAIDWFTPIGPLNFSFSESLSKADTDVTETFRFNLGTTF